MCKRFRTSFFIKLIQITNILHNTLKISDLQKVYNSFIEIALQTIDTLAKQKFNCYELTLVDFRSLKYSPLLTFWAPI